MSECLICYEKFNKSSRKETACFSCDKKFCRKCIQMYLTSIKEIPRCPECNTEWTLEYISTITPKSYHNIEYRKHRTSIALDREKGLLVETQPQVEIIIQQRKNTEELEKLHMERFTIVSAPKKDFSKDEIVKKLRAKIEKYNKKLEDRLQELDTIENSRLYIVENRIKELENIIRFGIKKEERKQFIKACPIDGCRGFLSTAWKCGLCETWICKDCHEKKAEKDDESHTCNPDSVETAKLIASETKPCPTCAIPIYKINGCFSADTQIIMWNGSIKNASDIAVGDQLIGDDGTIRTVEELVQGEDNMYEIVQYTAEKYIVNSQHKLCLKLGDTKDDQCLLNKNSVDIPVYEYIKLSDNHKDCLFGYKSFGVNWPKQTVEINPYILGMWLGDIKLSDPSQLIKLSSYNLVNNKHIPLQYLVNDRKTRLYLLAGIIDTGGYITNKGKNVTIIQENYILSEHITTLCRSLGFITDITKRNNTLISGYRYEIYLSGDSLEEIPTLLPKKRCVSDDSLVDLLRTPIKVNKVGISKYYGWRVDGNNKFILKDFTVVHNCDQMYCTVCHTAFSWSTGKKETGVIHNPHYYEWQRQQNNGVIPRAEGDIVCGGLPDILLLDRHLLQNKVGCTVISQKIINDRHRLVNHILHVDIPNYNVAMGDAFQDLRIKYLLQSITEQDWISYIQRNEKRTEKNHAIVQVLRMFTTIMSDMFNNILTKDHDDIIIVWEDMEKLRKYTNDNLLKIHIRFNNTTPYITKNWESVSITSKDKDRDIGTNIWTNIYEIPTAISNTIRLVTDEDNNLIIGAKTINEGGFCYPNLMAPDFTSENIIEIKYITFRITSANKKTFKTIQHGKYEIQIFTKVEDNLGIDNIREDGKEYKDGKDGKDCIKEFSIGDRVLNNANRKHGNILLISSDKNMCKVVYDDSRVEILHKSVLTFSRSIAPHTSAFIIEDIIPFNIFKEINEENIHEINTYTFKVPIILKPGNIMSIVNKNGSLDFTWSGDWNISDPVKFRYLYAFNYGEKVGDIIHRIQSSDQLKPGFYFGININ